MTYSYPYAGFLSGLNIGQLQGEIKTSLPTLTHITNDGNDVNTVFSGALTGPQQTTLNGIIAAHVPVIKTESYNTVLSNHFATRVPNINDDSTKGYSKGSNWLYDNKSWICLDPANPALWDYTTNTITVIQQVEASSLDYKAIMTFKYTKPVTVSFYLTIVDRTLSLTDGSSMMMYNTSGFKTFVTTSALPEITISIKKNMVGGTDPVLSSITTV